LNRDQPTPIVLHYASKRDRRWVNDRFDVDLIVLSLAQLLAWISDHSELTVIRPFWGDKWSIFALAWYDNRGFFSLIAIGVLGSLTVLTAALQPRDKRANWYHAYLGAMLPTIALSLLDGESLGGLLMIIAIIAALIAITRRFRWREVYLIILLTAAFAAIYLHVAANDYMIRQCPGPWGSLLLHSGADGSDKSIFMILFQPTFWILLIRSLMPRHWVPVELNLPGGAAALLALGSGVAIAVAFIRILH
jgi:hypothetical protein